MLLTKEQVEAQRNTYWLIQYKEKDTPASENWKREDQEILYVGSGLYVDSTFSFENALTLFIQRLGFNSDRRKYRLIEWRKDGKFQYTCQVVPPMRTLRDLEEADIHLVDETKAKWRAQRQARPLKDTKRDFAV